MGYSKKLYNILGGYKYYYTDNPLFRPYGYSTNFYNLLYAFLFIFTKSIGNRHFSIHYERSSIPVIMLPQESDSVYQIKLQIPVC